MTTDPTPDDLSRNLAADLALCEAATPGPWTCGRVPHDEEPDTVIIGSAWRFWARVVGVPGDPAEPNADMIAAARAGWPAALRRALRVEALLRRILPCLDGLRGHAAGLLAMEPEEGEDPEALLALLAEAELLVREMKGV